MRRDDDVRRSSSGPEYGSSEKTSSAAPATFPLCERLDERVLVDQLAAGDVDDADAVLHPRRSARAPISPRVSGRERRVERRRSRPRREGRPASRRARRRARGSARARRTGRRRARASRSPRARRATCWPIRPKPIRPSVLPASSIPAKRERSQRPSWRAAVRLRDLPREGEEEAERVLGGRDDGRLRRVGDHDARASDAAARSTLSTPTPGPADHLQPLGALDQVGGELRPAADDDRVVVADRRSRGRRRARRRRRSARAGARSRPPRSAPG